MTIWNKTGKTVEEWNEQLKQLTTPAEFAHFVREVNADWKAVYRKGGTAVAGVQYAGDKYAYVLYETGTSGKMLMANVPNAFYVGE